MRRTCRAPDSLLGMAAVLSRDDWFCVYVPRPGIANLELGLAEGVWGWSDKARARLAAELRRDPRRPNAELAKLSGCSERTAQRHRVRLEQAGEVDRWPGVAPKLEGGAPLTASGLEGGLDLDLDVALQGA